LAHREAVTKRARSIPSFNGRLRDERLNVETFFDLRRERRQGEVGALATRLRSGTAAQRTGRSFSRGVHATLGAMERGRRL